MGFVAASIFYFVMVVTMPDGQVDQFAPAFQSEEDCSHMAEHIKEWVDLYGGEVEHFQPCQEVVIYFEDGSV